MTTAKKNGTAAQETLEAVAEAQKKTIEEAVQAGTDAFAKGYEQFYNQAREQLDKAQKSAFENMDQITDFSRENAEALIVSGNIVAKGAEVVGKEFAAYAQKAAEANIEAAQKLSAVKNPQEFLDLQAELAKAVFDDFIAESSKLQDMSTKVSNEAAQPLNERLNKAVETFSKSIAA